MQIDFESNRDEDLNPGKQKPVEMVKNHKRERPNSQRKESEEEIHKVPRTVLTEENEQFDHARIQR